MNIKRKEIISFFICLILVVCSFSSSASVMLNPQSSNTHVFKNIFGHCDDLHIKYNKVIIDESVEIVEYGGAVYYNYEIEDGYVLSIWGFFPPGSSLEITVKSDESGVLFPVIYQWTIGGVPASPEIPVIFKKWPFYKDDGHFEIVSTISKPPEEVNVYVILALNIEGGIDGVEIIISEAPGGGSKIRLVGKVNDIFEPAYLGYIIDPPGEIYDETFELEYNVEFKGLFGIKAIISNIGQSVENLNWSMDMSGLILLGKHSEGVIDSFPSGTTEEIGPKFVFGLGPSIITVFINDMTINASCFVFGPLILGIKQPPT